MTERIAVDEALFLATNILIGFNYSHRDADIVAQHLVTAELRGYSGHGLRRLPALSKAPSQAPSSKSKSLSSNDDESSTIFNQVLKSGFTLFESSARLGIVAVVDAIATLKTRLTNEAAIVFGLSGYIGTTGCLGIYAHDLAEANIASILMCSSEYAVAPHGGARALLGTNPIAFGFPGQPVSFCADIATAAWSYGAIKDAALAGTALPVGVVQTIAGTPSTDPNDADNGSQLPMAGHKGYALGLAIELLCGPLIGGKAGRDAVPGGDGFFGVLIRSDSVRPPQTVNDDVQALFAEIKNSPWSKEDVEIRVPGEQSLKRQKELSFISVPKILMQELRGLLR